MFAGNELLAKHPAAGQVTAGNQPADGLGADVEDSGRLFDGVDHRGQFLTGLDSLRLTRGEGSLDGTAGSPVFNLPVDFGILRIHNASFFLLFFRYPRWATLAFSQNSQLTETEAVSE